MAAATVMSAMSADDKTVHPFFSRQQGFGQSDLRPEEDECENPTEEQPEKPKRTNSKRNRPKDGQKSTQKTLGEIVNPKALAPTQQETVIDLDAHERESRQGRRKRRRTNDDEAVDVDTENQHAASGVERGATIDQGRGSPIVLVPSSSPLPVEPAKAIQQGVSAPRKLLRLNAQGRFSSPPSKEPMNTDDAVKPKTRRSTRQCKALVMTEKKQLLVEIKYGEDEAKRQSLGERIQRIIDDEERVLPRTKTVVKKRTPQISKSSKPTHPFFAKAGHDAQPKTALQKQDSPRKASAVTPGKLRIQSFGDRLQDSQDSTHVFASALLRDRHMMKHPGAKEPPFPAKEQVHVRNLDEDSLDDERDNASTLPIRQRKCKQAKLPFPDDQSLLLNFASQLRAEDDRVLRPDGFHEPPTSLHVPQRLLISGEEITERIASEISLPLMEGDMDELSSSQSYVHPALQNLYKKIPKALTALDMSTGEMQAWLHRYAPSMSMDVLQPEKEMGILRDWMKSLSVQSVVGAAANSSTVVSLKTSEKLKKKRKKKSDEMDDFLVDDGDELNDMSEVVDDDTNDNTSRRTTHSVVQTIHDGMKLSNAVLLSGPHGCGKTAAAYAVAKELGFKVFEISSSERRSGRDVLDRVGDMTANHLVKHHGVQDSEEASSSEEPSRADEEFQKDLQSGRQGKMHSFFKSQAQQKPSTPKRVVKEKAVKAVQEALKKSAKDQQQSLILLEEVDVLFKDDKDFWSTVFNLMSTSKRPFIMTCNDEDLVPLQAMSFHAILRLSPPSPDLATDYMLLLAAAEGHLLKRSAVASLYDQQGHDLRASITGLDYWCQKGVGDPRGGLSWIYQRWPPGSDLDAQGRQLRVVSDGSYQQGMGLPQNSEATEDSLLWLWSEFGIEPSTALGWRSDADESHAPGGSSAEQRRRGFICFTSLVESLSATDACTRDGHLGLDTTQPPMPEKARGHYIEGTKLLQTDERADWTGTSAGILAALTNLAYRTFDHDNRDEDNVVRKALSRRPQTLDDAKLSRHAFACFDPIATPAEPSLNPGYLLQSTFDGTFETIALDVAPYIRSIVQYDQSLEEQRDRFDLLTSDGRRSKRARTTRAARSALEGSQRATVRRERWFTNKLDMHAVLATGGRWPVFASDMDTASVGSRDGTGTGTTASASVEESEEIRYE